MFSAGGPHVPKHSLTVLLFLSVWLLPPLPQFILNFLINIHTAEKCAGAAEPVRAGQEESTATQFWQSELAHWLKVTGRGRAAGEVNMQLGSVWCDVTTAERLQAWTLRAVKTTNLSHLSITIYGWNERAARSVTRNKFDLLCQKTQSHQNCGRIQFGDEEKAEKIQI